MHSFLGSLFFKKSFLCFLRSFLTFAVFTPLFIFRGITLRAWRALRDTFFFWIFFILKVHSGGFIIGGADVCISVDNSSENRNTLRIQKKKSN